MRNKVVWMEGMFLQPHHFQQHDRYFENLINQKTTYTNSYSWGFHELIIHRELLALGKFSILSARGVFPDGTVFQIPEQDSAPIALDIPDISNNTLVYLTLPLQQPNEADTAIQSIQQRCRYTTQQYEITDSISGSNQIAQINVGQLSLQLQLEQSDRAGFTAMPIARIKEVRSQQQIILDDGFLPPCLNINSFQTLKNFINEVFGLLQHRADMLAYRLTDTQQSATAEIADFLMLQLVNRYEPLFWHLTQRNPIAPEFLYRTLLQLLGELSTFTQDKRRPSPVAPYHHERPAETFLPLMKELRHCLSMVLEQNAIAISLQQRDYGVWVGEIVDRDLLQNTHFVLAIYADLPTEIVRNSFPIQVKIAPVEYLRNLVSRALPGIGLQVMPVAPRQIPYHANFSYFSFDQKNDFWHALEKSAGIAFHVGGHFPGLKLELWAIKG